MLRWLEREEAPQLFWLMGGGGVGKSVLSAELLARLLEKRQAVAWHFCRHDNKEQSSPTNLLRSIAAMLCHTLDGFEAALLAVEGHEKAFESEQIDLVFDLLIMKPLNEVEAPASRQVVLIDALDELPREGQKPLLDLIVQQLSQLPKWLRLFVTSREEPLITKALSKFKPEELRADEEKNRTDVEVYLRTIARKHVKGDVNMSDVAKAVHRRFRIELPKDELPTLQQKIVDSRGMYEEAMSRLRADPELTRLNEVAEKLQPKPTQESSDFETVYGWAKEAHKILEEKIASEWVVDAKYNFLRHPKPESKAEWVDEADNPGVKGRKRAEEKMKNDYDGDAAHLKDLARQTLVFHSCERMVQGLKSLEE
ncbi:MAG: hypothetical protein ACO32I_08530, partial [Candidatus Limnocylindrus sp.]